MLKKTLMICLGALLMALSLNVFLEPNGIQTGGASGIAVIAEYFSRHNLSFVIPMWFTNLAVNLPLLMLAKRKLGTAFAAKTLAATLLLSLFLRLTQNMDAGIGGDDFINCVFGGVFMGIGVGLVFAGGATTGGSDLLAALFNGRGLSVSTVIFISDVAVILAGVPIFGAVKTMYSVTAVYISSKAINLVLEGLGFARVVFIMSDSSEAVAEALMKNLRRGATFLYGRGAYTGTRKNVIMIVVSKKQVTDVKRIVMQTDGTAFVFVADVREVMGDFARDHYI